MKPLAFSFTLFLIMAVGQARANSIWTWNYSGDGIAASGTFLTADTANGSGYYEVLSIQGNRNGDVITGLVPAGAAIPGNEPYGVDNLVREGGPAQITVQGFGYSLASGAYANPYFADFLSPPTYSEVLTQGPSFAEIPIAFSASPIPEPSSVALVISGILLLAGIRSLSKSQVGPIPRR